MKTLVYPLVLILSIWIFGCKEKGSKIQHEDADRPGNDCIERILADDSTLGNIRNHETEQISLSQTIANYTAAIEALDFSGCPEDFYMAFQDHIEAWRSVTKVTDKHPALRGEMHDVFAEVEKTSDSTEFKILVKAIWDTWAVVEENTVQ